MICGDLRENRKRWWKVRRTNQPAAPMSTSAFPVLSWAADHPKRWHDIGKLPETLVSIAASSERSSGPVRSDLAGARLLVRQAHDECQSNIQSRDVPVVEMTDLSSNSLPPNGDGLVGHHLRPNSQSVLLGRIDRYPKIRRIVCAAARAARRTTTNIEATTTPDAASLPTGPRSRCRETQRNAISIVWTRNIRNHSVSTIPCATMYVGNERWQPRTAAGERFKWAVAIPILKLRACFAVFRQRTGLPGASSSQCSTCSAVICVAQWVVSTAICWMVQNVLSSSGSSVVRL